MSAALGTVIKEWMIPRMNAHHIRVEAFAGNTASVRVFEKNGFVLDKTVPMTTPIVTNSGETVTGIHVLWWRA